jgi:hypothetical protein
VLPPGQGDGDLVGLALTVRRGSLYFDWGLYLVVRVQRAAHRGEVDARERQRDAGRAIGRERCSDTAQPQVPAAAEQATTEQATARQVQVPVRVASWLSC